MPYQRQTHRVSFKGRTVADPSKALYAEAREQDKVDNAFIKDMEQRGKDYQASLVAWDKNLAALDQEKVNFFKQVSPAMEKLLGQTLKQGLEIKERADVKTERERFSALKPEERVELKEQSQEFYKNKHKIKNERASLADKARELGLKEYAEYVENLNKTELATLQIKLMEMGLPSFRKSLDTALLDDERKYTYNGKEFTGATALSSGQFQVIAESLEDDFRGAANIAGVDHRLVSAVVGDRAESIREQWLLGVETQISQERANELIRDTGEQFLASFHGWDPETGEDAADFQGQLNTVFLNLARGYRAQGKDNPDALARNTVKKLLDSLYNEAQDKPAAREKIDALLSGNNGQMILHGHKGYPKGIALADLDDSRFSINKYWTSNQVGIGDNTQIAGIGTDEIQTKSKEIGWSTTSTKQEDIQNTTKYKWTQILKNGGTIPEGEYQKFWDHANRNGAYTSILAEIMDFKDGSVRIYDAKESTRILKDLEATHRKEFQKDIEVLNLLDKETLDKFLEKRGINLVENVYGTQDNGGALDRSNAALKQAIQGDSETWTVDMEKLFEIKSEQIKNRVLAKRYPPGERGKDAPIEELQNEGDLIDSITGEVINSELPTETAPGGKYERNKETNDFNLVPGRKSIWARDQRERARLEMEVSLRKINEARDKNTDGSPISKSETFFTRDQLLNVLKNGYTTDSRGRRTYTGELPADFIKASLEMGEWPADVLRNQIERINNAKDKEGKLINEPIPPELIQATQGSSAWQKTFKNPRELLELTKILDDGDGRYSFRKPNKTAARIVDEKLNQLLLQNGQPVRPNEAMILNTVQKDSGGDYRWRSDTNNNDQTRLGKYGIPLGLAKELYSTTSIGGAWPGAEKFLQDEKLQDKLAGLLVKSLIYKQEKAQPTRRRTRQQTMVRKNTAVMLRGILNDWTGADPNDPNTQLNNTLFLNSYYQGLGGN